MIQIKFDDVEIGQRIYQSLLPDNPAWDQKIEDISNPRVSAGAVNARGEEGTLSYINPEKVVYIKESD